MQYQHDRNWGCRISDEFTFRGHRLLVMENELLRVTVILDQGADIYEFMYKPHDVDFMWRGPVALQDPRAFVPTGPRADGFFADYYHGGWQEIFPNGGVHLTYKGAELAQHGEVSLMPWKCTITKNDPDEVSAKMWVRTYRTPFYLERTLTLKAGSAALHFSEKVVNEGREPMDFMWGHHPAVGEPFLDSSCRIDIPARKVAVHPSSFCENSMLVPGESFDSFPIIKDKNGKDFDVSRIPPPEADTSEMCYLLELESGWYGLTNTDRKIGFGMQWDKEVFPVVWLWEVFRGNYGFPWYGRTYNIAIEPWTSWPGGMETALAEGTTRVLGPGESLETELLAVAYEGISQVTGISHDGKVTGK